MPPSSSETTRHDAWQAGDSYEAYMGRWSRRLAPLFLDWLGAPPGGRWLELGCGSGALTAAVLDRARPARLLALDPSEGFVATARANTTDSRAEFRTGDAQALDLPDASCDVVVSGLVLNFIPDRVKALAEMRRVARPGAVIGLYVWDYPASDPGGGMQMMRRFWTAAAALDPAAAELAEDRRFPFCTPAGLAALAREAGLGAVETTALEIATPFRDFDDYWRPFTLGTGPAPGYAASLAPEAREALRRRLEQTLPRAPGDQAGDNTIPLTARAWAMKAIVT
jgi:SAM-dependent methyltransferase